MAARPHNGSSGLVVVDDQSQFPDYDVDLGTISSFLAEHTILVRAPDDDDDNENDDEIPMLEPTSGSQRLIRVPCYPPLLQRIKDKNYFHESQTTFIVEIPLQELIEWDSVRGADIVDRTLANTLRYRELFCRAIDNALDELLMSVVGVAKAARSDNLRDTIDILQEQRLALHAIREQNREQNAGAQIGGGGIMNDEAMNQNRPTAGRATENLPSILLRRYELRILPVGRRGEYAPFHEQQYRIRSDENGNRNDAGPEGSTLRHIRSKSIGRLVSIRGMVVRSSDVKPYCQVATYSCDACGCEVYQVIDNKREFVPERICPSPECQQPGTGGGAALPAYRRVDTLHLQTRGSKFVKFQELKLQELPSQVPMGHVPRSMSVYCRGELARMTSPGDVVTVDGVFLPQRVAESGFRAMKAGLVTTLYLEAQHIQVHKKSYDKPLSSYLPERERAILDNEIQRVATADDPIGQLSFSIAPEIFGYEDIKRALLLQLVGGCTRKLPDGMRIRGDINICLMGDPGCAKSQLLKHIVSITPRSVYTTGKGSSGVGLTASITRDTTTKELSLEGGSLVLADQGICAIDEFDKMDESDRAAIHEVMEQQTVSVAKAGIVATLNARAAVLAAANPLYSRYNRRKSLSENINLPNSLLSRFDLLFLILDTPDMERDMALARHVTSVHMNEGVGSKRKRDDDSDDENGEEETEEDIIIRSYRSKDGLLTPKLIREYISRARKHQPIVPKTVAPYIIEAYISLRQQDYASTRNRRRGISSSKSSDQTVMTPRQLLSILRISQAIARLRFSDYVAREDVDEAIRLTHMSKASLLDEDPANVGGGTGDQSRQRGVVSRVFEILREYSVTSRSNVVDLGLCEAMVLRKGFTAQNLQACLEEYETLGVIMVNEARTSLVFVA